MTRTEKDAILVVRIKEPPQVRKGKAMLQIHIASSNNTYRLYDLQGTIMPAADKAEWLINVCLFKAGPSGHLNPGAFSFIME